MNVEIACGEVFIPEDFSCPCAPLLLKPDPGVGSISWVTSTATAVIWLMEDQKAGAGLIRGTRWARKQSLLMKNDLLAIYRQLFSCATQSCCCCCCLTDFFFIALEDSLVMSSDLPLVCVFNIKEEHRLK